MSTKYEITNDQVTIYADGSCDQKTKVGGWACILKWRYHTKEMYGSDSNTTNQRMELTAAIEGLKALTRKVAVTVKSDSAYLVRGAAKWCDQWAANNWLTISTKRQIANADLWVIIFSLKQKYQIVWQYVPERDSLYIQRCHELAILEMKKKAFRGS